MPAGLFAAIPLSTDFLRARGRISCSTHNLAGPGALGTTAHFEASNIRPL